MSKKFVILTTRHRHKPSEFKYVKLLLLDTPTTQVHVSYFVSHGIKSGVAWVHRYGCQVSNSSILTSGLEPIGSFPVSVLKQEDSKPRSDAWWALVSLQNAKGYTPSDQWLPDSLEGALECLHHTKARGELKSKGETRAQYSLTVWLSSPITWAELPQFTAVHSQQRYVDRHCIQNTVKRFRVIVRSNLVINSGLLHQKLQC
jgi:hypothetical protein